LPDLALRLLCRRNVRCATRKFEVAQESFRRAIRRATRQGRLPPEAARHA
jgi:hypothetical protein